MRFGTFVVTSTALAAAAVMALPVSLKSEPGSLLMARNGRDGREDRGRGRVEKLDLERGRGRGRDRDRDRADEDPARAANENAPPAAGEDEADVAPPPPEDEAGAPPPPPPAAGEFDVAAILAAMADAEAGLAEQLQTLQDEKAAADQLKEELAAQLEAEADAAEQANIQAQIQINDDKIAKLDIALTEFQEVVDTFNAVKTDLEANQDDAAAAGAAVADNLADLLTQEERIAQQLADIETQKAELADQKAQLEEQIAALDAAADAAEIAELEAQIAVIDGLTANLDALKEDLDQTQAVVDLIQQLLEGADAEVIDEVVDENGDAAIADVQKLVDDVNKAVTDVQTALQAVTTTLADNQVNADEILQLLGLVQRTVSTANLLDTTIQGGVAGLTVV